MFIKSINLNNFKNIEHASLQFSSKLNCFLGNNGMGKSNLLDAIYFLSFCKSFAGLSDAMLISQGEDFAMLQAQYDRRGIDENVAASIQKGRRKIFKRSGKEYQRLSQHIGAFPLVLISPSDMDIINGPSEERRRFMDMVISQTDARYLDMLIRYGRGLEQRNRMLRDEIADPNLYTAVEAGMEMAAQYICDVRRQWIDRLSEIFSGYYTAIAGNGEKPALSYKSHMAQPGVKLVDLLAERTVRDRALHYTTAGPHRDDIEMSLAGMPVKNAASQGQAKTYTIALRCAQYVFLKEHVRLSPILLLDDIFDKLDARRVERIMQVVTGDTFGQIFITDTNRKHLDEILALCGDQYAMWHVENGVFTSISQS